MAKDKEIKRFGTNQELLQYLKGSKDAELELPEYEETKKTDEQKEA